MLFDVVEMDACHLILGRPWQYDVDATHKCRDNVYVVFKNGRKIVIGPIKKGSIPKASKVEREPLLLVVNNEDTFDKEARESKQAFAVVETDAGPKQCLKYQQQCNHYLRSLGNYFQMSRLQDCHQCATFNTTLIWSLEPAYQTSHITK